MQATRGRRLFGVGVERLIDAPLPFRRPRAFGHVKVNANERVAIGEHEADACAPPGFGYGTGLVEAAPCRRVGHVG